MHRSIVVLLTLLAAQSAQSPRETLMRGLYGSVAVEAQSADSASLAIGVADSGRQVVVMLRARDVRSWADSATRLLAAPIRRKGATVKSATVAAPGKRTGSISLLRRLDDKDAQVSVLFADTAFAELRTLMPLADAQAMVLGLKRAAAHVLGPPRTRTKAPARTR